MRTIQIIAVLMISLSLSLQAQLYNDYIGAGHSEGITVSTSSNSEGTDPTNTINAAGMDVHRMSASRFLRQATVAYDSAMIEEVADIGIEAWIDDQMTKTPTDYEAMVNDIWYDDIQVLNHQIGRDTTQTFGPYSLHFNYAYWQNMYGTQANDDYLRQRIAYAYSQIFVVSENTELGGYGEYMAHWFDMLGENAFGNYRDIIEDVTLHLNMGYYLSHLNNPKADPANNINPDENFAREIMQLFTIGLYLLNNDGTQVLDGAGDPIPTYDNVDVKEAAKVFTGLMPGGINKYVTWTSNPYFGLGIWGADHTVPMQIDQMYHETSEKTILKGLTIPANQPGMQDVMMLLDTLYNHPNAGPFISRRLIQHLVKSNPTPSYIQRMTTVFNDNGSGVRGDMGALIKAILLDPEARTCAAMQDFAHGKLQEPFLRNNQAQKLMGVYQDQDRYYNNGFSLFDDLGQSILQSPTVFNFFRPDYQPSGDIANNDLYAPEFQIHNTTSAISVMNQVNGQIRSWDQLNNGYGYPWWDWELDDMGISLPESQSIKYRPFTEDPDDFLDRIDLEYMSGQMTDEVRNDIREAMLGQVWGDYPRERVNLGLYLTLISPDFAILK